MDGDRQQTENAVKHYASQPERSEIPSIYNLLAAEPCRNLCHLLATECANSLGILNARNAGSQASMQESHLGIKVIRINPISLEGFLQGIWRQFVLLTFDFRGTIGCSRTGG